MGSLPQDKARSSRCVKEKSRDVYPVRIWRLNESECTEEATNEQKVGRFCFITPSFPSWFPDILHGLRFYPKDPKIWLFQCSNPTSFHRRSEWVSSKRWRNPGLRAAGRLILTLTLTLTFDLFDLFCLSLAGQTASRLCDVVSFEGSERLVVSDSGRPTGTKRHDSTRSALARRKRRAQGGRFKGTVRQIWPNVHKEAQGFRDWTQTFHFILLWTPVWILIFFEYYSLENKIGQSIKLYIYSIFHTKMQLKLLPMTDNWSLKIDLTKE